MRRTTGVVLDANDIVRARRRAHEVDETNAPAVPSSAEPHGYATLVVSATFTAQRDSEEAEGTALPEVGVERPLEVAGTWCYGLVGFEEDLRA